VTNTHKAELIFFAHLHRNYTLKYLCAQVARFNFCTLASLLKNGWLGGVFLKDLFGKNKQRQN
jgi:hypothetical protein